MRCACPRDIAPDANLTGFGQGVSPGGVRRTGREVLKRKKYKVLHLGNVANYGYNIGKVLQTDTIESHTLNWDYYHFASRPEWEEGEFDSREMGDHYFPNIPGPSVTGFRRPRWYVHGPQRSAALCLIAMNEGKQLRARLIRFLLDRHLRRLGDPAYRRRENAWRVSTLWQSFCMDLMGDGKGNTQRAIAAAWRVLQERRARPATHEAPPQAAAAPPAPPPRPARELPLPVPLATAPAATFDDLVEGLRREYLAAYPHRDLDPLLLRQFEISRALMQRLFAPYDLVIGYAIDGIWPLMAGKPYMAYEFGTIRNIPFTDDSQGRLAFLAYRRALRTIVTNSDTEDSAKALGLDHFFLPHVINESGTPTPAEAEAFRAGLVARHGGDFFVFHPPRQHWNAARDTNWDKGNDHLLRGFASFVRDTAPEARCICVEWGESVADSRRLVEELGIGRNVIWIAPQPHRSMMRYIAACDAVADQFSLSTFGGIPPKAFHLGRPVISCFDPAIHAWCYSEMPPIAAARTAGEIAAALARLHADPEHKAALGEAGRDWYRRHNSNARIREILGAAVTDLLEARSSAAQRGGA